MEISQFWFCLLLGFHRNQSNNGKYDNIHPLPLSSNPSMYWNLVVPNPSNCWTEWGSKPRKTKMKLSWFLASVCQWIVWKTDQNNCVLLRPFKSNFSYLLPPKNQIRDQIRVIQIFQNIIKLSTKVLNSKFKPFFRVVKKSRVSKSIIKISESYVYLAIRSGELYIGNLWIRSIKCTIEPKSQKINNIGRA